MLIPLIAAMFATTDAEAQRPILGTQVPESDRDSLLAQVAPLLEMTEEEMLALVPAQAGLYFTDCPNCDEGYQEGQFAVNWKPTDIPPYELAQPEQMRCKYCAHVYPSDLYPMDDVLKVESPTGETHRYPFWADDEGYRHFFAARLDYLKIRAMEEAANAFARLHVLTGEADHARRSALIIHRFGEVYPGYCYHVDLPFREKEILPGNIAPKDRRSNYRTAHWTWWSYMDVPRKLVEAYDLIAEADALGELSRELGTDVVSDIELFLVYATDDVLDQRDDYTNMSPGMWGDFVRVGRVVGRPEYVHEAILRLRRFVEPRFFYDGAWKEGAPSYHSQTVSNLGVVIDVARGYSDPPGYEHPATGERFDDLDVAGEFPLLEKAAAFLDLMCLPNGRMVPVHDTWHNGSWRAREESTAFLLPGLGHACLARGAGDAQVQAHLTWSPGYGHVHFDGLSLIFFAGGKELLSDVGYTHTKARGVTLATAGHNTVVIDLLNQTADKSTYGALRYFDASDSDCQLVSVDNPHVYPDVASKYRRTLGLIGAGGDACYLLDVFEVTGGDQHDYFLHGCADEPSSVAATAEGARLAGEGVDSLLPDGFEFKPGEAETDAWDIVEPAYAYGYLANVVAHRPGDGIATVDHSFEGQEAGLRTFVLTTKGDELMTGTSPAIRGAGENDAEIDQHHRPFALLRRRGGESTFISLSEPHAGAPAITSARVLEMPGTVAAVEVAMGARTHLILVGASGASGSYRDLALKADAELAILVIEGDELTRATVVGGSVAWGEVTVESGATAAHGLLGVDRDSRSLLVDGAFAPTEGSTILVDHAGERVSPYTVEAVAPVGDATRITTTQDPGFIWDPETATATFELLPGTTYVGPHGVRQMPVTHFTPPG